MQRFPDTSWIRFVLPLLMIAAAPGTARNAQPGTKADALAPADFARDIQPILAERCYECHGEKKQKSGLRLDRKADALRGGDSGKPAIVPGQSRDSRLIFLITNPDPDEVMPPKGNRLSATQVALFRRWMDAGAPWPEKPSTFTSPPKPQRRRDAQPSTREHWAFVPPKRPPVPRVKKSNRIRNPIDAFVSARLARENIEPSPEADRVTLIRRLYFDLIGLPPTAEEVEAFLKDKRPDAYEQRVDGLLGSPHFGEHWGRHWLDLARYADSDGYEKDSVRPYAWLYRDWVIDAVNRDLPFDQFTIEQLAGDLLPDPTVEQKTATGFHRQTLTNKEGGVDQEEFRCKATVDRTSTTATIWLGLTVGCAECHSHKYDPITQREFYQVYAFFNNASEQDVAAPRAAELARYRKETEDWKTAGARLKAALEDHLQGNLRAAQARWEAAAQAAPAFWQPLEPQSSASAGGATLKVESNSTIVVTGKSPLTDTYTLEVETDLNRITGFRLELLVDAVSGQGPGRAKNGNLVLSEFNVKVANGRGEAKPLALTNAIADFSQKDYPVAESIDGNLKTGWAVSPQQHQRHVAVFETVQPQLTQRRLSFALVQEFGKESTIARFRISATTSAPPFHLDVTPEGIAKALSVPTAQRDAEQTAALSKYYREEIDPGTVKLRNQVAAHATQQPKFPETKAMALAENEAPRNTHIHIRGDFLRKGDPVQPGVLSVLHPFQPRHHEERSALAGPLAGESSRPADSEVSSGSVRRRRALPDRLDLARWLIDPANPLTGRVTVNHVWKHLFGRGLVATVDDFGTRGEKPSHPDLLDWLAVTFLPAPNPQPSTTNPQRGLGWSRKALIRLIVTSSTYRQSSRVRPDLNDRDPNNLLLARQNRFRLEAENVRDAYLAASGLLAHNLGGPSVRPPLPADIAAIGYANSVKWKESEGADRYRRGLYTFFQRTVPYPMLATFDAPDANVTCTRRERSNTPIQALTALNDPVFFECARALGRRIAAELTPDPTEKIRKTFKICLGREPAPEELARLVRLYHDQSRLVQADPASAAKIVGDARADSGNALEAASLVAVARTLLNLDEFVTRE